MPAFRAWHAEHGTLRDIPSRGLVNNIRNGNTAVPAACRAEPDETVTGEAHSYRSSGWFEKLRLPLVEEHGCLEDLCLCLG